MEVIEALQVVISNTKATEQAIVNSQNAIITALHATAQNTTGTQAGVAAGGNNPLAGYTTSTAGHVPGSGAPQPVGYPAPGGASTGYSTPPPGGGTPSGGGPVGPPPGGAQPPATGGPGRSPQPGYNQPVAPGGQQPGLIGRLRQSLGGGALTTGRFSGLMGLASEAYTKIVAESENAARYQGMEGGTSRVQGGIERLNEVRYAARERLAHGLSGMTMAEAQQAYADVTSFGYRDNPIRGVNGSADLGRRDVLDFMARNKTNMGMSEGESFQAVNAAVGNTRTSLQDLSDALHQVSNAAEAAGVNALVARQNFLTMFNNLTQAGAGQGAARLASAAQTSLAGYGRDMQNIDTSSQFSSQWQYRAAANAGMAVGTYQNAMRNNPGGVQRILDRVTTRGIENAIGMAAVNWIKQRASQPPYSGRVAGNPEMLQNLADEYQDHFQPNLLRLQAVIQNTSGVQVTEDQVTRWVVGHVLGMNASAQMNKQTGANEGHQVIGTPGGGFKDAATGRTVDGSGMAKAGSGNTGQEASLPGGKALDAAQKAYANVSRAQGGKREPMIEAVLGKVKDHNQKVIVFNNGQNRQVSLAEAIKYFPNEIAKGRVIFASGDNQGKSVEDVAGIYGDTKRSDTAELGRTDVSKIGHVISDSDLDALKKAGADKDKKALADAGQGVADDSAAGGTFKLDLSDSAKKLLKLIPSGSKTGGSAASGARPDPGGATDEATRGIVPPIAMPG